MDSNLEKDGVNQDNGNDDSKQITTRCTGAQLLSAVVLQNLDQISSVCL